MLSEPCEGSYRERHINSHSNQKYFQLIIDVNLCTKIYYHLQFQTIKGHLVNE